MKATWQDISQGDIQNLFHWMPHHVQTYLYSWWVQKILYIVFLTTYSSVLQKNFCLVSQALYCISVAHIFFGVEIFRNSSVFKSDKKLSSSPPNIRNFLRLNDPHIFDWGKKKKRKIQLFNNWWLHCYTMYPQKTPTWNIYVMIKYVSLHKYCIEL